MPLAWSSLWGGGESGGGGGGGAPGGAETARALTPGHAPCRDRAETFSADAGALEKVPPRVVGPPGTPLVVSTPRLRSPACRALGRLLRGSCEFSSGGVKKKRNRR